MLGWPRKADDCSRSCCDHCDHFATTTVLSYCKAVVFCRVNLFQASLINWTNVCGSLNQSIIDWLCTGCSRAEHAKMGKGKSNLKDYYLYYLLVR